MPCTPCTTKPPITMTAPTVIAAHALCSRCAEADGSQVAYYRDFISKECVECNGSTFIIAPLTFFAVLLLAIGVWLATSTKASKIKDLMDRKKETIATMRDQVGAHACVGFMIKGSSLNLHMPRRAQPSCYTTDAARLLSTFHHLHHVPRSTPNAYPYSLRYL